MPAAIKHSYNVPDDISADRHWSHLMPYRALAEAPLKTSIVLGTSIVAHGHNFWTLTICNDQKTAIQNVAKTELFQASG